MPRVALVYPYFRTRSSTELLFPPLGAASLSSQLHKLGIETKIFDCTFKTFSGIKKNLKSYQPDIVGIYSMVTLSRNTFRIAEMVRTSLPDSLLVAGGPLPTLYPEQYSGAFDVVFRGEADLSFPRFCQDLFHNKFSRQQFKYLTLEKYEGLFIQQEKMRVEIHLFTTGKRSLNPSRFQTGATSITRLIKKYGPNRMARRQHPLLRHWDVHSVVIFAPGRSSAVCSAAGTWMQSSLRSSRSASWVMTAYGSLTTTSLLIFPI